MSTDSNLLTLADALREAVAGKSEPRRIAAARRVVAALAPLVARRGGNRRGPKERHDRKWAESCLLEFAIEDPDGLPAAQKNFVDRLRIAFERRGTVVPGETWLRGVVRDFYSQAEAQHRELCGKYRSSPELVSLFPSAKDFIFYTRMNARFENRWRADKTLQQKHLTASAYIETLTNFKPETAVKIGAELAKSSEILSEKILK